ncbi:fimbrial protein [Erwinia aphidicola]|uniref:fimbrial protein n=1 Tax=Erwinia aphidicola TaxID=68334 RepID=UPI003CEDB908
MTSGNVLRWLLTGLSAGWISLAVAGYESRTITISMTVLEPPPCTINGGKTIEVDFGEVIADDLDGIQFARAVNIDLSCRGQSKNQLRLQFQGTPDKAMANYLQTNREGLAIKFSRSGQLLPLNSWLNFNWPDVPELRAAPVISNKKMLTGGTFSASATLRVEYQ